MNVGEQLWCILSEEMSFENLLLYGPMLAKTNKQKKKKKKEEKKRITNGKK